MHSTGDCFVLRETLVGHVIATFRATKGKDKNDILSYSLELIGHSTTFFLETASAAYYQLQKLSAIWPFIITKLKS